MKRHDGIMAQRLKGEKAQRLKGAEAQWRKRVKIFSTPNELAEKLAEEIVAMINAAAEVNKKITVALPGGSTPELLFSILGDHFSAGARWENAHFFWGDERCVAPDNPDSNYGTAWSKFLSKSGIPAENIHRIRGEEEPEREALRYSEEISHNTKVRDGLPVFDLILLGLGDDGHTASIFPGNMELIDNKGICSVSVHPVNHQQRITLTGRIINNAVSVVFLITGKRKAAIVEMILNKKSGAENFPASFIVPLYGDLHWYLDEEAANLLVE